MSATKGIGTLYVISAPSGAGKTSLVKALVDSTADIVVSVSHTTRAPRPGEQDGVHYHFVDLDTFDAMAGDGAFLEHAEVFGNRYGTSRSATLDLVAQGIDVILEIDWQGARNVRAQIPTAVGIFVLPPSRQTLEQRLRGRGQDSEDIIQRRMAQALSELSHYNEFDYLLVNDDFERALAELRAIVTTWRLRAESQHQRLAPLVQSLLA